MMQLQLMDILPYITTQEAAVVIKEKVIDVDLSLLKGNRENRENNAAV